MLKPHFDVAIVGASLAGCAAARLLAQQGFGVALVEKQTAPDFFKPICTHYLLSSATPALDRLGLLGVLDGLGAIKSNHVIWTPWGWIPHGHLAGTPTHGYSLPRASLDPALRQLTLSEPNVWYLPGHKLMGMEKGSDGRIAQLIVENKQGQNEIITARLYIGADGRSSKFAKLAALPEEKFENNRFLYYRYFRNLPLKTGNDAQVWMLNPDMAYCFPNPDNITLVAAVIGKSGHATFKQNIDANIEKFIRRLPDSPDFSSAVPIGSTSGMYDLALYTRKVSGNNLALIGDAALTTDPIAGAGCGWALQSAEWLVDCVSSALKSNIPINDALEAYSTLHQKSLLQHQKIIAKYSAAPVFEKGDGALFSLLARDVKLQSWFHSVYSRNRQPSMSFSFALKLLWQSLKSNTPVDKNNYNWESI